MGKVLHTRFSVWSGLETIYGTYFQNHLKHMEISEVKEEVKKKSPNIITK